MTADGYAKMQKHDKFSENKKSGLRFTKLTFFSSDRFCYKQVPVNSKTKIVL